MITSKNNEKIVLLRKLVQDKKHRLANNCYVIEGLKLIADACRYNKNIVAVYANEWAVNQLPTVLTCPIEVVDKVVLESVSSTVSSQGALAVVEFNSSSNTLGNKVLALDGLQDPGNVGTIMRSAVAFGFNDIILANCVDIYSPKVIRSAMSAHFAVATHVVATINDAYSMLNQHTIVVADMGGSDIATFSCPNNLALVLGNEGNGVSQFAVDNASSIVSLPMSNNLESLNVAVAGSLLMYLLR